MAVPGGKSSRQVWCGVVGVWSVVFAAPHAYWALGGRAGLGAQASAADAAFEQGWFAAYNLAAGVLALASAAAVTLLAADALGSRLRRWFLVASAVACVVLLLRGALGSGLLLASAVSGGSEKTPLVLLAIEPWFVVGGAAFGGMVLSQRRSRTAVASPGPAGDTSVRPGAS